MPTSDIKKGPLYVDSTNNRVGIGEVSPTSKLTIGGNANTATNPTVQITDTTNGGSITLRGQSPKLFFDVTAGGVGKILMDGAGFEFKDGTLDAEGNVDLKIDSTGILMVGKTTSGLSSAGHHINSQGYAYHTYDSGTPLYLNRKTNDGAVIALYRDSLVGSIGTNENTDLYIAGGDTGLLFNDNVDFICPATATGSGRDNAVDLGYSTVRWDDVYATNGTIQTSDANEKQQIAALTDAEITAAKAISALFKTYKWNDKVAEKGDAARTHTGVIAQDVQAAMTAAGLDASDYAFFISSTWWETQTEVPAVEAVDAVLDEDGNVVTEAVEAVAAYTRTDTYETAEEAPEGATERNRKGIRYPELLAFVGAATEQRLANIETRLAALEAN